MRKFKLIKDYPGNVGNVGCTYTSNEDGVNGPVINALGKYIKPLDFPENFEEMKQVIFVSKDNVGMFAGDRYYYTNSNFVKIDEITINNPEFYQQKNKVVRFANPLARDRYIEENKPMYSLKDVAQALTDGFYMNIDHEHIIDKVKELLIYNKRR